MSRTPSTPETMTMTPRLAKLLVALLLITACASSPQTTPDDTNDNDALPNTEPNTDPHGHTQQPTRRPTLVAVDESDEGKALDNMADDYRREVERVYANLGDKFNQCYLPELKRDPNLRGSFVVEFTVVSGGSIGDGPNITQNTINNPKVETCVLNLVKKVKYPEPYNEEYATVKRLFKFGAF